ncbi:hypothetical protein ACX80I_11305 [Arthrobacter sp. MDT3-44]
MQGTTGSARERSLGAASRLFSADGVPRCTFLLEGAMSRADLEGRPDRLERARAVARGLAGSL